MNDDVLVPGGRQVRGTVDVVRSGTTGDDSQNTGPRTDTCVVACPPHPQHGGHRGDARLEAVGRALTDRGIDCLRIDYGDWDEGYGEREDACNAVRWATERYDRVGLFGYSFGGAIALLAGARIDDPVTAVATLAPAPRLGDDEALSAVNALTELLDAGEAAIRIVYGERDSTVDPTPLLDVLEERIDPTAPHSIERVPADHFFVGQHERIGERAATFLSNASDE